MAAARSSATAPAMGTVRPVNRQVLVASETRAAAGAAPIAMSVTSTAGAAYYRGISTAGPMQSATPRTVAEQIIFRLVRTDPSVGSPLSGLNNDSRFQAVDGWQKMEYIHRPLNGRAIVIHYQYNSVTRQAYDVKVTSPVRR